MYFACPCYTQVVVVLNEHGGLVDLLPCGQLSGRIVRSFKDPNAATSSAPCKNDPKKSKDVQRLLDKIFERKPHALVVSVLQQSQR